MNPYIKTKVFIIVLTLVVTTIATTTYMVTRENDRAPQITSVTSTTPVSPTSTPITQKKPSVQTSTQVSWVSNPERFTLTSIIPKKNAPKASAYADCASGSTCTDQVIFEVETPNYYSCTVDTQCAFFTGFTGTQTTNELPLSNVPGATTNSTPSPTSPPEGGAPTTNPGLPTAVNGSSGCFNRSELLKNATNKNGLQEVTSTVCECGIQPPSYSIQGSPSAVDATSGKVTDGGTMSRMANPYGTGWSCMRPEVRPDIMVEHFVFPQQITVNQPFSVSFDYKNVGLVGCTETYFQVDVTRTIAGQSASLGGIGAHITRSSPLAPGAHDAFNFGDKLLPPFDMAGDYALNIAMVCEIPKETHVVNGIKEIHIQVR